MQASTLRWQPVPLAGGLLLALLNPAAIAQAAEQEKAGDSWFSSELRRYRAYSHLHEAYRLMQEKRLGQAAERLKQAVDIDPHHRESRLAYLQLLKQMNRSVEVLKQANQYLSRWPGDPAVLLVRAFAYERTGRPRDAERDYEAVQDNRRATPAEQLLAARAVADAALYQGRPAKALAALETALRLQDTAILHLRKGQALAALRRLPEAEQAYALALAQAGNPAEQRVALRGLADLAIVQQDMNKALPHLRRLVDGAPGDLATVRQLVHAHHALGQHAHAVQAARLLEKSPEPADAFLRGSVLAARGDHGQAQAAFAQAARTADAGLRGKALLAEGYSARAAGNMGAARSAFMRATRLPGGAQAARELAAVQPGLVRMPTADSIAQRAHRMAEQGYAALAKDQAERAMRAFEEALRLREHPLWRVQLARAYRQQGDLAAARAALAAIEQPSVGQLQELAAVSIELGDVEAGVQALGKAARTSDQAQDYLRLARTALEVGLVPVSLHAYRVAHTKVTELPAQEQRALLAELGYVHLRSGDTEQAYRMLAEAEARAPDPHLAMELAGLDELAGRTAAARERLATLDPSGLGNQQKQHWYAARARLAQAAGDLPGALTLLQRSVADAPSAPLHHQLGLAALAASDPSLAREHLDQAYRLDRGNWSAGMQLGYVCLALEDLSCAIAAFEHVAASRPDTGGLAETLGYSYARQGDNERAVAWFKRAIDALDTPDPSPMRRVSYQQWAADDNAGMAPALKQAESVQGPAERARREGLRQQIGSMTREWQLNAYQSVRERGAQLGDAGLVGSGALPSQGGLELQWRPPGLGYRDGRILQLESRLLWSNQPGKLAIDHDTLQGSVGLAFKPFKSQDAFVRVERLFKVGKQAQDNWLVHASWGAADGWGWNPAKPHWNYSTVYVDAGVLLQHEKTRSLYVEARQGRAFGFASRTVLTPHLLLAMRGQRPDPAHLSYVEAGAGASLKTYFNGSRYVAERSSLEFFLQYRKPIARQSGGWVFTAAVQF